MVGMSLGTTITAVLAERYDDVASKSTRNKYYYYVGVLASCLSTVRNGVVKFDDLSADWIG